MTKKAEANSVSYVAKRIRKPLEGGDGPVGLSYIVGTHGADIDSVFRLARDGRFSGGAVDVLQGRFYLTPNLRYRNWKLTNFGLEVGELPSVDPLEVAKAYAESGSLARFAQSVKEDLTVEDGEDTRGVVLTFGRRVLELVESVYVNDLDEPEAQLREAPPLESVKGIYPVDSFAAEALNAAINSLR